MKPLLKWAGGKRWLAKKLVREFPDQICRYIEPFFGSGAVFFEFRPDVAIISDANAALIEMYQAIRDNPEKIYQKLQALHTLHNKDMYYKIRAVIPDDPDERAARFIYLNRTCWNGLYRVNKKNEFNVPIGTKSAVVFDDDNFVDLAAQLKKAEISCCDFAASINRAGAGDLIYVDPPYCKRDDNRGFLKYNRNVFSWDDQLRLRDCLTEARGRGAHIVLSNADSICVRSLYEDGWASYSVPRSSVISASSDFRVATSELVVTCHGG